MSFYESICENPILVSSPEIAETAKLLENTFRLVNIALINEVAQICNDNGISVSEVVEAASTKPYGFMKFTPGVGVGGHCIPVDPLYLTWWARNNGSAALLVEAADKINIDMPKYVAQRALDLLESAQASPRVLILGVAYKPGVGDIRETPVSELRKVLQSQGAIVGWHDPFVTSWEETLPNELTWNCDIAIIATNQPGVRYASLLDSGVRILDCAGTGIKHPNITSL
jgi:UDP-N-acetyl-D-glucosamine dehydrogenase